jgi:hypothetical protein
MKILAIPTLAFAVALTGCTTHHVPVATQQQAAVTPAHLKKKPKKIPRLKGPAKLDKHLREQARTLQQQGNTRDTLVELQEFGKDQDAVNAPRPTE